MTSFTGRKFENDSNICYTEKIVTDRDPKDQSIYLDITRSEAIEMLQSLNISVRKDNSTATLKQILRNRLKLHHPIHQFLPWQYYNELF